MHICLTNVANCPVNVLLNLNNGPVFCPVFLLYVTIRPAIAKGTKDTFYFVPITVEALALLSLKQTASCMKCSDESLNGWPATEFLLQIQSRNATCVVRTQC